MSQKILGDMKGIYVQMHEDAAFEAAVEDIVISISYNMLSEGKSVDEIVEVLSSEDDEVILEHYAAAQHSTTLTEDLDYDYYTEDFELVCERLGLLRGLVGLAKGGGKLLMKGGKALVRGATPIAQKVAGATAKGARVVKAKIGRAIGPKGRKMLKPVVDVVKKTAVPATAGVAGYMLGKGEAEAEKEAETPKAEAPKKDEKPAYPGGQSKKEGEEINKKYQELRTKAVDPKGAIKDQEAVKKAEEYGKAQWAKLYPELAKKVKPDGTQKGTGQSKMEKDAAELRAMQKASQERQEADKKKVKKEAYEVVLDYLLSEGHADSVEEAHYVMMQLDSEYIQGIVEGFPATGPVRVDPAQKLKLQQSPSGRKYYTGPGGREMSPEDVRKVMSGELMVKGGKKKPTTQVAHYEPEGEVIGEGDPSFQIKKSSGIRALSADAAKQLGPKAEGLRKGEMGKVGLPKLKGV